MVIVFKNLNLISSSLNFTFHIYKYLDTLSVGEICNFRILDTTNFFSHFKNPGDEFLVCIDQRPKLR